MSECNYSPEINHYLVYSETRSSLPLFPSSALLLKLRYNSHIKFTPLKCTFPWVFETYSKDCTNITTVQFQGIFISLQKKPQTHETSLSTLPFSQPLATTYMPFVWSACSGHHVYNGMLQSKPFCVWLLLLSRSVFKVHALARHSFYGSVIFYCMNIPLLK